jgi:WD40 repeat protein
VREGAEHGFVQARFNPDQQSIAALAAEGERRFVKLWLAPLQREPTFLGGAAGLPRHLSITPDGRWLFASWNDFTAWNLETNREEFRLPKGNINAVAYDAKDGRCAVVDVVGPNKVSVKFLDLATRLELFTLCQSQAAIHCLALSPDGNQLAVPLFDNPSQRSVIKLWDLRTGEASITCAPHAGQVWAMAFADDGQRLIAASSPKGGKGELTTWNAATGAKVQAHTLDTDEVFPAAFSPDCRYLATSSAARPGEVKLWDVASGQLLGAIPLARRGLSLAFSRDGKHLAIGTDVLIDSRLHGLAKICKVPSCEEVVSLLDPGESFYRVAFHPQGRWLVTAHQHVKIWDLKARLP